MDTHLPPTAPRCSLVVAVGAVVVLLFLPGTARAHGDPVSEVLAEQDLFLPLHMNPDSDAARQLRTVVREANEAGFHLKLAVISEPTDLGPRSWLYRLPRRFAVFLARDVAPEDGVLVVMPTGFGYARTGGPAPDLRRVLASLRPPGRDARREAQTATVAVRRLAAARGYVIEPIPSNGASETRDRLIIASAGVAAAAILAGGVLIRRKRRTL